MKTRSLFKLRSWERVRQWYMQWLLRLVNSFIIDCASGGYVNQVWPTRHGGRSLRMSGKDFFPYNRERPLRRTSPFLLLLKFLCDCLMIGKIP